MADQPDDVTKLNEGANSQFNGKDKKPKTAPQDANGIEAVNEAANAEFNAEGETSGLGDTVGGLRGSPD